jgi:chaperone modulatory protein CbpM
MLGRIDFLTRSGLDPQTLEIWVRAEWLAPAQADDDLTFSEADVARARLIVELQRDLGVNDEGIGVILNLIDQVHGLRRALAGLLATTRASEEKPAQLDEGNQVGSK